ncbi:MAG: hypothetical protein QXW41_09265 [Fervidicoccaceae archaeon]
METQIFRRKKKEQPKIEWEVIDLTDRNVVYIDGKPIPRNNILSIDTERKIIIYIDTDGKLKQAKLE